MDCDRVQDRFQMMKVTLIIALCLLAGIRDTVAQEKGGKPLMMFGDPSRTGSPFSKDPHVIFFEGRYLMYYSIRPYSDKDNPVKGLGIGIAESDDLIGWRKTGEIIPAADYEAKGLCAPCARVIDGKVHLFYQTYGNGKDDAICHATSTDGITFMRNSTNPVFRPGGDWNCGRAIDAEVIEYMGNYYLYYATRDPSYKIQMLGVAMAPGNTDFGRQDWTNISEDAPILKPELGWEKDCIEGASVIERKGKLYMFYAGAYNNAPQQIGVAESSDGISWKRLSEEPFLKNGAPGSWNSSESGHPHIFRDENGRTWLFFQGNNDNGKTWFLSKVEVKWTKKGPVTAKY
jgi:sucrose-6-phosphate hydrolase SacC (GH32 family)